MPGGDLPNAVRLPGAGGSRSITRPGGRDWRTCSKL